LSGASSLYILPLLSSHRESRVDAILTSLGLVFLAEIGDKTQILALLLAARFQRPWPVIGGMVAAVILNHALAVGLGFVVADQIPANWLRWAVAFMFIAMAVWLLIPDKAELGENEARRRNAFVASLIAFFFAEMGDKTQIATIALAARYHSMVTVMIGSSIGMLLADAPVIWFGEKITKRIPGKLLHRVSAILFALFGVGVLLDW
jgi:putative Ca2+/H+ antiporter (TMEM165/GDT1 family)